MGKGADGNGQRMGLGHASDALMLNLGEPGAGALAGTPRAERLERAEPSAPAKLLFDDVYRLYFAHVVRWSRALGGLEADVDDLAQDVFVVVNRRLDSFAGGSLSAWIYGITRKTVSDYRRRAWMRRWLGGKTRSLESVRELVEHADEHARWEAQATLQHVLSRMTRTRRVAFQLFEIEGYSGQEISELEQIPLATVHTRLYHARRDFVRLLAESEAAREGQA